MARSLSTATLGPSEDAGLDTPESFRRATLRDRWSLLARIDRLAIVLLVCVPVLIRVPAAIAGRPFISADNLNQNYPIRVLAGELIAHGRLPLWDPYIWSGTPLLAGWNAGALYPGTWLYAIMPGPAAWTINFTAVWIVCGVGTHVFLRRIGCSPLAALLGASTFTYTGFMLGQADHFGLVAGMSFTPWMLLAVHELGEFPGRRAAWRWIALLGGCGGLVVLAGDPRAATSIGIIIAVYFLALCRRARERVSHRILATARVLAAMALAIGISAVQWLPGLVFLHESDRGNDTFSRFAQGSLSWHNIALLFVPFLVGGHGNFGFPSYEGSYNIAEVSYAVGIVPLVAAFALARRALRERSGESPIGVWYALIIVGTLLTAGSETPLGRVLAKLPLYGGERLQNRNVVIVDLALAVLLAVFVDLLAPRLAIPGTGRDRLGPERAEISFRERRAGLVPVAIVAILVFAAYVFSHFVQREMGVSRYLPNLAPHLTRYYVATLLISAGAAVLLIALPRLAPQTRRRLVTVVVAADVLLAMAGASYETPQPTTLARTNPAVDALSKLLAPQGRYAIFNPAQSLPKSTATVIHELGPYDLNILHQLLSVQGYGSAVSGRYENVTGSHEVENLQPAALNQPTLDTLNLQELVTLPEYLVTALHGDRPIPVAQGTPVPPGTERVAEQLNAIAPNKPLPSLVPFLLTPGRSSAWILPGPAALDSATIVLVPYDGKLPATISVGILDSRDQLVGDRKIAVRNGQAVYPLHGATAYGLEVGVPGRVSIAVGAVAVSTVLPTSVNSGPPTHRLVLNQVLQGVLEPPRWRYQTTIGGLSVFTDTLARGPAWLEPAGATSPVSAKLPFADALNRNVEPWQNPVTVVSTPRPAVLVRSVAYESGWIAKVAPLGGGRAVTLSVRRFGTIQAISVPAGRFVVTWVYTSTRAKVGLVVSGVSTVVLALLFLLTRRRRKRGLTPHMGRLAPSAREGTGPG